MELLSDSEIETKQFHAKDAQSLVFCSQVPQPLLFYTSIKNRWPVSSPNDRFSENMYMYCLKRHIVEKGYPRPYGRTDVKIELEF